MRWNIFWAACIILAGLTGCQKSVSTGKSWYHKEFVKGPLPDFVAGVWKEGRPDVNLPANICVGGRGCWDFTLEPDGSISQMRHNLVTVPINVKEGGVLEDFKQGVFTINVLGPCGASYETASRKLKVKVVIDYFRMEVPGDALEGSTDDVIVGTISDDGKVWNAEWWSYGQIEGADKMDPNEVEPVSLTFYKEEKQAE
jgi:hypothetical protein